MDIYAIGFTQTTPERFFGRLREAGIRRLLDVRLNNSSQLARFAKAKDLPYFRRELVGTSYEHAPLLAPMQEMLDEYKKRKVDWAVYEEGFMALMEDRSAEKHLERSSFSKVPTALLCSEATAEHCHRRLVLEYLGRHWPDLRAVHL